MKHIWKFQAMCMLIMTYKFLAIDSQWFWLPLIAFFNALYNDWKRNGL